METAFQRERKRTDFTQGQVVEALEIPLRSLQAYEEGEYPPPFDRAMKLADLYGGGLAAFAEAEGGGKACDENGDLVYHAFIPDISCDYAFVSRLAEKCTAGQLDLEQLLDVVYNSLP